ncbi:Spo0E family sporulation regulatory protein-aspartic acid phosphatase [Clostridium sp. MSJ-11]|uniref:Spo0E family sporulation regulatory protein-aspartic acid phosphatase n=1 Tax=Clostridium mobile TaxID=2841512 RepID=A0ABS6ENB3_9CLOT|nr:Spo0E family sporulation regulatory protein-aspartic acid phosphatase [Clostridium mobile]MBU5486515.1 Spo0E family sporulation regulatory protein-aspartic acid phosphatase [Clostridium mobile]
MNKKIISSSYDLSEDFIFEKEIEEIDLNNIEEEIEVTRQLLNEISCDIDKVEKSKQILEVSQYMDKLLNEYINMVKNKK